MRRWNYLPTCATSLNGALEAWQRGAFDVVLLDLRLGDADGLEFIRTIRSAQDTTPVIAVTAKDAISDRIEGLDAGADDYLVKPFDLDELAARLRAIYRRSHNLSQTEIQVGELWLDTSGGVARYSGDQLDLSRREFLVLRALAERAGRIVSRAALERAVYGNDPVTSNALEVHVHALRRKIRHDAIKTVRGLGYMMHRDS